MNPTTAFLTVGLVVAEHDLPGLERRREAITTLHDELRRLATVLLKKYFQDSLDATCLDDIVMDCLFQLIDLRQRVALADEEPPVEGARAPFTPDSDGRVRAYLKAVVRNRFLALLKKQQRHASLDARTDDEEGEETSPHMPTTAAADGFLIEAELIARFKDQVVPRAAEAQHPSARAAFVPTVLQMFRVYGFGELEVTWQELAEECGEERNTLQKRFERVRTRLLDWIDASDEPPEHKAAFREIVTVHLRDRRPTLRRKRTQGSQQPPTTDSHP